MRKLTLYLAFLLFISQRCYSQQNAPSRLKVFIDCECDIQLMRSEINIVDFSYDNAAADVHVLITRQNTGSGGYQFQLIFFGQHYFKNQKDTLRFGIPPNATGFEERDLLLQYVKAGLVPFIVKTSTADKIDISLKTDSASVGSVDTTGESDPWNAWVFRTGADINFNADANYKHLNYSSRFSVNRITDKSKIGLGFNIGKTNSTFEYEENGEIQKLVVDNHNWTASQYLVKSINAKWSAAYEIRLSQNTFNNTRSRVFSRVAAEYNIFPYTDVNNKLFTLSYGFTLRSNRYYDTTIFNKTKETLYGQRATASVSFNQKWGNVFAGLSYQNYLHDWKLFNLGFDVYLNMRITGGLSFFMLTFGGLTRDQVFLVKGDATPEEVLTRRRQLASGYNFYSSFGLSYQFGSKINNVVNPRFDRSHAGNED